MKTHLIWLLVPSICCAQVESYVYIDDAPFMLFSEHKDCGKYYYGALVVDGHGTGGCWGRHEDKLYINLKGKRLVIDADEIEEWMSTTKTPPATASEPLETGAVPPRNG